MLMYISFILGWALFLCMLIVLAAPWVSLLFIHHDTKEQIAADVKCKSVKLIGYGILFMAVIYLPAMAMCYSF